MNTVDFDDDTSCFIVTGDESYSIPYKHDVPDYLSSFNLSDFDFFLLKNPYFYKEKDIFEVYLDNSPKRNGYLFHFDLLTSEEEWNEHSNLNDYLYISIKWYFSQVIEKVDGNAIGDFYENHSDLFILVINHHDSKKTTELKLYLLDLLSLGFSYETDCIKVKNFISDDFLLEKRINLKQRNSDWMKETFISNILLNMMPVAQTPELSFYLAYQVIEFFMRTDKEKEWAELLVRLPMVTASDYKDIGDQIHDINKEKPRIKEIFENSIINSNIKDQFQRFYISSGLFLSEEKEFYEKFYSFRNMFTHNYEALIEKKEEKNHLCFYGRQIVFEILKSRYTAKE